MLITYPIKGSENLSVAYAHSLDSLLNSQDAQDHGQISWNVLPTPTLHPSVPSHPTTAAKSRLFSFAI